MKEYKFVPYLDHSFRQYVDKRQDIGFTQLGSNGWGGGIGVLWISTLNVAFKKKIVKDVQKITAPNMIMVYTACRLYRKGKLSLEKCIETAELLYWQREEEECVPLRHNGYAYDIIFERVKEMIDNIGDGDTFKLLECERRIKEAYKS